MVLALLTVVVVVEYEPAETTKTRGRKASKILGIFPLTQVKNIFFYKEPDTLVVVPTNQPPNEEELTGVAAAAAANFP